MPTIEKKVDELQRIASVRRRNMLIRSEVRSSIAISLPLPTMAWGEPAFAYLRLLRCGARKRRCNRAAGPVWVVAAHGGRLTVYALCSPFILPPTQSLKP